MRGMMIASKDATQTIDTRPARMTTIFAGFVLEDVCRTMRIITAPGIRRGARAC